MRMTKAGLQEIVDVINRRTGGDYELDYSYGRPRLAYDGGSRFMGPRLPAGQLADWMRAFLEGFDAGTASARSRIVCGTCGDEVVDAGLHAANTGHWPTAESNVVGAV